MLHKIRNECSRSRKMYWNSEITWYRCKSKINRKDPRFLQFCGMHGKQVIALNQIAEYIKSNMLNIGKYLAYLPLIRRPDYKVNTENIEAYFCRLTLVLEMIQKSFPEGSKLYIQCGNEITVLRIYAPTLESWTELNKEYPHV